MAASIQVKLTANFECKLAEIEAFLTEAGASGAFNTLLDQLLETVVPNLERFPDLGRPFFDHPAQSVEGISALEKLRAKLGSGDLREYVLSDYLLLYARYGSLLYLLSIKHHRQLSFDFDRLWGA